jgi:drug/metabolite transporter (DMT)-like permease
VEELKPCPEEHNLLVTAVIFSLVALLHLVRIIFGWSAVIGGWSVPMWLSWVALIVTGALAYFGFSLATRASRKGSFG